MPERQAPHGFDTSCARCRDGGRAQFYTYEFGEGRVWHFDVGVAAWDGDVSRPRSWAARDSELASGMTPGYSDTSQPASRLWAPRWWRCSASSF